MSTADAAFGDELSFAREEAAWRCRLRLSSAGGKLQAQDRLGLSAGFDIQCVAPNLTNKPVSDAKKGLNGETRGVSSNPLDSFRWIPVVPPLRLSGGEVLPNFHHVRRL
jgi:hypothetical protein